MNMYLDFTTKQLNEYNKLIKVIESCSNPDHHTSTVNIIQSFGKLCDNRKNILKKRAWVNIFKFNFTPMTEYMKYKEAALEQVQSLIDYSNYWLDQYNIWETEQQKCNEENKKERIKIIGFSNILRKKSKR